jgi:leucine dehydrogenase
VFTIVAVHSTVLGPSLGGCRMWRYDDTRAALRDALRLSRAMTFKSAVAGNRLGGGKGVIMLPEGDALPRDRRDVLLDFADTVDALRGSYITAEDVGTSAKDMEVIARGTKHVSGLSRRRGGSGDPSPSTALGVHAAIEASVERVFGSPSLKGRTVVLTGLGHVGMRLAKGLLRAGAKVLATDIDRGKRDAIVAAGGRWIAPDRALTQAADVFAPCALGGILTDETVDALQVPIVAGAANNQLADDTVAGQLAVRGILWAPDFVANAGGIINIDVELERKRYDPARAKQRVQGIGDTMRRVFDVAEATGVTPLDAAMALARERLADAG